MPKGGPYTLKIATGVPYQKARTAVWEFGWKGNQKMVLSGWDAAIDWIDKSIREGDLDTEEILYAGERECPWYLGFYMDAADAALRGDREEVFDFYSQSAMYLMQEDKDLHDALVAPWKADA